jgi:D-tyrosyl-tRNA(Tyr) deacylase
MRSVVQRVDWAQVDVAPDYSRRIGAGLLALVCIESGDDETKLDWMARKIAGLRIFSDDEGKMNRSVIDINGSILVISQFTLAADIEKGFRPSFSNAAPPVIAEPFVNRFVEKLRTDCGVRSVETGIFGAHMDVTLHNNGPVTIFIEK